MVCRTNTKRCFCSSLQMYQDAESKQVLLEWMKERQEIR